VWKAESAYFEEQEPLYAGTFDLLALRPDGTSLLWTEGWVSRSLERTDPPVGCVPQGPRTDGRARADNGDCSSAYLEPRERASKRSRSGTASKMRFVCSERSELFTKWKAHLTKEAA